MSPHLPLPNPWVDALPAPKPMAGPHRSAPGDLLLHLGEAWYPPAPSVLKALATLDGRVARYPDPLSEELRHELASYCGHGLTAESILIGNGSDGLIDLLVSAYAGPERPVAAPAPTFFVYGHSAALRRAPFVASGRKNQAEGFAFSPELFLEALPPEAGVIFLASPNNPTGDVLDLELIRHLAERTRALLVIDECYFEFCGETALSLLAEHPHLVILRSLSKSFALAGLRSGYAIAHPSVIAALAKADQTFSVNVAAQLASVAALRALDYYRPLFARTVALREAWSIALRELGLKVLPSRANILLVEYAHLHPEPLAPKLREAGIHVADFHDRPGLRGAFRVSVDERSELDRVVRALRKLLIGRE